MSDHYNQPASQQEMDLSDIFSLIGRFIKNCIYFIFRIVDFIIRKWWIILLLIVAGIVLGYFTKGAASYEANLLLKTNFKSQSYVYTAINQFNNNLAEGDTDFVISLGKDPSTFGVASVEVAPVVEVLDLIAYIGENDRALGEMTREFKLEDDRELFATDRFLSTYKYHKLTVGLKSEQSKEDIASLMSFINDQPFAKQLKEKGLQNHKEFIAYNEKTLKQLDELVEGYTKEAIGLQNTSKEGFYYNNRSDNEMSSLFDFKIMLSRNTEELKNDDVSYTDVAVIVSDIQASRDTSILDNMIIIYPLLFVILFLFISGTIKLYNSYKAETLNN
ncbi:hypothetical protein MED134_09361 [Dokdonia sp. MED134]|uniref:hypothetical protein n=1 Tax=Dokdonia sp. MED134 TaxID=313590 RepID=UPI000068D0AF|nr:hypothetical protein [Dokdonia sp. MED134]EAQ39689.1 hypothetical protein MED134_09361 [Dokdonia sp. MED134]